MKKQHWIFLSPHLDDVALSCGGLVWDLVNQGFTVEIWTVMAGIPHGEPYSDFAEMIHLDWGILAKEAVKTRREEDKQACEVLGVKLRHYDWLDGIYREDPISGTPLITDNVELFSKAPEDWLVEAIRKELEERIPVNAKLIIPISLGAHIDHRTVVQAANRLQKKLTYYADYPYVLTCKDPPGSHPTRWKNISHHLNGAALNHWQKAILCYASQISSFWHDEDEARMALSNYCAGGGGRLWQKTTKLGALSRKLHRKLICKILNISY